MADFPVETNVLQEITLNTRTSHHGLLVYVLMQRDQRSTWFYPGPAVVLRQAATKGCRRRVKVQGVPSGPALACLARVWRAGGDAW